MIVNFEQITENLPNITIHKYALCVASLLSSSHVGVGNEIKNANIKKHLASKGFMLDAIKVRQTLHYIRVHFNFVTETFSKCVLCANSKGYYLTDSSEEVERYKLSLRQRVNSINEILECM